MIVIQFRVALVDIQYFVMFDAFEQFHLIVQINFVTEVHIVLVKDFHDVEIPIRFVENFMNRPERFFRKCVTDSVLFHHSAASISSSVRLSMQNKAVVC